MSTLATPSSAAKMPNAVKSFDPHKVRADFPILHTKVHGKPLVYLDNGATTQKPQAVIDAIVHYYTHDNANIHRGVYELSQRATEGYEKARGKIAEFIGASYSSECIFTRGTTEGINLVASSWGRANLKPGDEIVVGEMEHHSNIVPWQLAAEYSGAKVRVLPMTERGELELDKLDHLLSSRTKLVAVQHVSNALGTIQDVETIVAKAHKVGAKVLVDGAQWVAHFPLDVQKLNCDFYVFSGHKLFGPTGIGVLWGRRELLEAMPPYHGGGDMIESVSFENTTYAGLPNKLEAGTPDIAGAIGLGAAIDYVQSVGIESYADYEHELLTYASEKLKQVPGLRILGPAERKAAVISFRLEDPAIATLDAGRALDREGIAVRTGHHCCMPIMTRLGIDSTIRASFAMYNTREDIDALVTALNKLVASRRTAKTPAAPLASKEVVFPDAYGPSPQTAADEFAELFEFLPDRIARAEQMEDFAKVLPDNFELLKKLTHRVPGCQAEVYMLSRPAPDDPGRLEFIADANATVVRGEIVMLQRLFSGQRASDILQFDVDKFFGRIGFENFLTQQRRTGLSSMIDRIRRQAETIAKTSGVRDA